MTSIRSFKTPLFCFNNDVDQATKTENKSSSVHFHFGITVPQFLTYIFPRSLRSLRRRGPLFFHLQCRHGSPSFLEATHNPGTFFLLSGCVHSFYAMYLCWLKNWVSRERQYAYLESFEEPSYIVLLLI